MYTIEGSYRGPKYRVKKSIFIASIYHVDSHQEVKDTLAKVGKEFRKASHNSWAFRLREGGEIISDDNDDGEVKGTAGRVIATHIEEFVNVLLVVTRFYGGINLGKGGLIRSYSKTALDLMTNIPKITLE